MLALEARYSHTLCAIPKHYSNSTVANQPGDKAVIELDPNDPTLDPWSALRDTSNDPKREPSPFYPGRLWSQGVLTFFQLPVALTPEDLKAGKVDVAILGAPIDTSIGMRGAGNGPKSLRESFGSIGTPYPHMHTGGAWNQTLTAVDYGDAPIDFLSVERSMPPVRKLVREIASTGANDGPKYLYISFDIDVLDPAYMPGTGTPEPAGLTTREVFPLIRALCTEKNVVGFDLVELNPLADPGYTTTLNSNRLIQECLTGIAMRKNGITDGKHLNPLTSDDAR